MTTQKLCSEKRSYNMSTKYFLGELKRSWPRMVLYFIIFCLTMVIPLLMQNMGYVIRFEESAEEHLIRCSKSLLNIMEQFSQVWTLVSMGIALLAGSYVTKILNNKISADFYHSIPMRRESIYLTRLVAGFISYFVTFLANVLIVLALCETQELAAGYGLMIFKQIMVNFGLSILAFFMIYSVTIFAGMLCGTNVMRLLMTLYLCFIVFTYYCAFFATLELFFDTFNPSYYIEDEGMINLINLLPFIRLLSLELIERISTVDYFFFAFASLAFLVGALALYKARKIEKAGTPIVFDGFATFFRYSVIIPATWLGGIFFYAIVGEFIWYIVGLLLGAFLSFLLLNTILWKNARKMFSGIKGLGIYATVMLVFFLCIGFDIFGVDDYVPRADDVKSVNIKLLNQIQDVDFEDRDVIKSAIDLDNSRNDLKYDNGEFITGASDWVASPYGMGLSVAVEGEYPTTEPVFHTDDYDQLSYQVVYKMKSGISIARRVRVMLESEQMTAFAKAVANSEEYENEWKIQLEVFNPNRYSIRYDKITEYNAYEREIIQKFMSEELILAARDDFGGIDYGYFQRPQIGRINFYGDMITDYRQLQAPIFVDDLFAKAHMSGNTIDDYYSYLASRIMNIVIYTGDKQDFSTEDGISLPKDTELYKEVLKNLANITETRNIFTESETGYKVGIAFTCSEEKYSTTVYYMTAEFLKDSVPASIYSYISK